MNTPEIGIPKSKGRNSINPSESFEVPKSCCKDPDSLGCNSYIRNVDPGNINDQVIYTEVRHNYLLRHENKQIFMN